MTIFQAIIYGIVQGLGEFLPISSTAHLIIMPWLFGWKDPGLSFDMVLHVGTLVAVLAFFWRDWIRLIHKGFTDVKSSEGRLFWYLVIATIPGGVAGVLFESQVESSFRNPALIGMMLVLMGLVLYAADNKGSKKVHLKDIGFTRSILIGISQVIAFIPGVSRSGITISTGLFAGLTRESAARYTFLLSTPIIAAGGLKSVKDLMHTGINLPLVVGFVVSALVGVASIGFLLEYLKKKGFGIFVGYRLILGALLILIYSFR